MQLFKDNQLLFFWIIFQQMPIFCGLHGLHMFSLSVKYMVLEVVNRVLS